MKMTGCSSEIFENTPKRYQNVIFWAWLRILLINNNNLYYLYSANIYANIIKCTIKTIKISPTKTKLKTKTKNQKLTLKLRLDYKKKNTPKRYQF